MLEFADDEISGPKIKVVGVGGGGGNAVNTMIEAGIQGVDFIAANTDSQVLDTNQAAIKVQIGKGLTKGLGAGANPEIGAAAAIEDAGRLAEMLAGADMVFVTAGMGGGTGTGAAPVIAQVARDMGALTVGVVTKPFAFEGLQRKKKANAGIEALAKAVDALIVIPNDRLVALAGMKMSLRESFAMVDNVCLNAVRGISDLVMVPGLINVDFADVRTIMTGMGRALMGSGRGKGDKRAIDAAQMAINSPLLEDVSINGATGILVNITGGADLTLSEVNEACSLIQEAADPDANIIFGSVIDPNCGDEVRITVIATGFIPRVLAEAPIVTGRHSHGHGQPARRGEGQMTLPMQPQQQPVAYGQAAQNYAPAPAAQAYSYAPAAAAPVYAPTLSPYAPTPSPYAPVPEAGSDIDIHTDPYPAPAPYMHAPLTAHVPVAPAPSGNGGYANDWPAAVAAERPNIRPPVPSPLQSSPGSASAQQPRRTAGSIQALADELGIEESEYDTPAYLRRSRASGSHDTMSYRLPGGEKTP
jgi:cell division protein FtsZ